MPHYEKSYGKKVEQLKLPTNIQNQNSLLPWYFTVLLRVLLNYTVPSRLFFCKIVDQDGTHSSGKRSILTILRKVGDCE